MRRRYANRTLTRRDHLLRGHLRTQLVHRRPVRQPDSAAFDIAKTIGADLCGAIFLAASGHQFDSGIAAQDSVYRLPLRDGPEPGAAAQGVRLPAAEIPHPGHGGGAGYPDLGADRGLFDPV